MPKKEAHSLVNEYVEKQLKKGASLSAIKEALLDRGYKKDLVEEVITAKQQPVGEKVTKTKFALPLFITLFAIIVVVVSLILVQKPLPEEVEEDKEPSLHDVILEDDETHICMALTSNDMSICDESPRKIENCYDTYYFYRSVLFGANMCDQITDARRDICHALVSGNVEVCENINSGTEGTPVDELKTLCKIFVKKDVSECNVLEGGLKSFCSTEINFINTMKNRDLDSCSHLESFHKFIICKASIMEDPNLCVDERISYYQELSVDDCKDRIDQLSEAQKDFCEMYVS